jgi:CRISPR/Cas system CMR-associated protein Cmr5 small subunit
MSLFDKIVTIVDKEERIGRKYRGLIKKTPCITPLQGAQKTVYKGIYVI